MRSLTTLSVLGVLLLSGCNNQPPAATPKDAPSSSKDEPSTPAPTKGKKVVMIIASQKFRDEELTEPRRILEAKGVAVTLASSSLDEATGMLGGRAKADVLLGDVKADDYDAVVFVGGSGASEYFDSAEAHGLCQAAVAQGKVLGAICIAPVTLAKAGVLKGKKATVWRGHADILKENGATYIVKDLEIDGQIITANGPNASAGFGAAIADALSK